MEQLRHMFSSPKSEQDQDPKTAPFANHLQAVLPDQNVLPAPFQGLAGSYSMHKGPYTHSMHQKVPQGPNGLDNTTDITMESDMGSPTQEGAANASVLPQARTLYSAGAFELSPGSAHGNPSSRHGLRLNIGNSPSAVTSAVNVFAQGTPQSATSPPFSSSSSKHRHGIASGLSGSISSGLGITIPNHSGSFSPSAAEPGLFKGLGFVSGIGAAAAGAGYGNDPANVAHSQSHQGAQSSFNEFRLATSNQQDDDEDNYNTRAPPFSRSPSRSPYLSAHSRPLTPNSEAHSPSAYPPASPYPSPGPSPLALSPGGGGLSPGPHSPGLEGSGGEGDDLSPTQTRGRLRGRPRGSPKSPPQHAGSAGPWSPGHIQQTQFVQGGVPGNGNLSRRADTVDGRHSRSRGKSVSETYTGGGSRGGSPYPHHGQVNSRMLGRKHSASVAVRSPSQHQNFMAGTSAQSHGIPPLEIHSGSIASSRDHSVAPHDPNAYIQPYPHSFPQQQPQYQTPHSDQYLIPPISPHSPQHFDPGMGSPTTGVLHSPHSLSPHSLSPHSVPPFTPSPELAAPNVAGGYGGSTHSSPGLGFHQTGGMPEPADLQFIMDPDQNAMQLGNMGPPEQGAQYAQAAYAPDGQITGVASDFGMTQISGSSEFPGNAELDSAWPAPQLHMTNMGMDSWPLDQDATAFPLTTERMQAAYTTDIGTAEGTGEYSRTPAVSVRANMGDELAELYNDPAFWQEPSTEQPVNLDQGNGNGTLGASGSDQWSGSTHSGQNISTENEILQQPIYSQQQSGTLPHAGYLIDPSTVPPSPAKGVVLPWNGQPTRQLPPGGIDNWVPNVVQDSTQTMSYNQHPHPSGIPAALTVPPRPTPMRRRSKSDSYPSIQPHGPQSIPSTSGYFTGGIQNSPRNHSNTLVPNYAMDPSVSRDGDIIHADGPGLKLRKTLPSPHPPRGHRQTVSAVVPSFAVEDWSDRAHGQPQHPPFVTSRSYQGPSMSSHGGAPLNDNHGAQVPPPLVYAVSGHHIDPQQPPFNHTRTYPPPNPVPSLPPVGHQNLGKNNSNSKQKQQGQRNEVDERKLAEAFMPGSFRVDPALRYFLDIIRTYPFYIEDGIEPLLGTPEAEQILARVRASFPGDSRFISRNDPRFPSQPIDKEAESQSIFMIMTENNQCLICGSQKDRTGRALGHVRSDIGHRPYHCACEKCSQSANPRRFFSDNLLDDHLKGQQVKQQCVYCHNLFRRGGMKRHVASKHPEHAQGAQESQEPQDYDGHVDE